MFATYGFGMNQLPPKCPVCSYYLSKDDSYWYCSDCSWDEEHDGWNGRSQDEDE